MNKQEMQENFFTDIVFLELSQSTRLGGLGLAPDEKYASFGHVWRVFGMTGKLNTGTNL